MTGFDEVSEIHRSGRDCRVGKPVQFEKYLSFRVESLAINLCAARIRKRALDERWIASARVHAVRSIVRDNSEQESLARQ